MAEAAFLPQRSAERRSLRGMQQSMQGRKRQQAERKERPRKRRMMLSKEEEAKQTAAVTNQAKIHILKKAYSASVGDRIYEMLARGTRNALPAVHQQGRLRAGS
jgi:hypothetical protein